MIVLQATPQPHQAEKAALFEEDSDDETNTYDFSIKQQFQGKQGGKVRDARS